MENNLIKINANNNEIMVIDTREIAEMMRIEHKLILRKLEGTKDGKTKGIIPIFNENKIALVDKNLDEIKTYPSKFKLQNN